MTYKVEPGKPNFFVKNDQSKVYSERGLRFSPTFISNLNVNNSSSVKTCLP